MSFKCYVTWGKLLAFSESDSFHFSSYRLRMALRSEKWLSSVLHTNILPTLKLTARPLLASPTLPSTQLALSYPSQVSTLPGLR